MRARTLCKAWVAWAGTGARRAARDVLTRPPLVATRLPCGVHSACIACGTHGEMNRDWKWCASRPGKARLAVGRPDSSSCGRKRCMLADWARRDTHGRGWVRGARRGKGACKFQIRARHPGRVAPLRSASGCVSDGREAGRPSGTPEYAEPERAPLLARSPGEAQSCEANGLSPEVPPLDR